MFLRIYLRMERDSKKIVRRLRDEGFELVSVAGSHHKFRKGTITVIVPHPKKDLPIGTARAIAKQAGWISRTMQ
jgi:predicted RNA binding protein YcfA (HicA-like mRNA interferase family)